MTSKELNRIYEKAKSEYLAEIQNDDGSYTCKGCGHNFTTITIHHIIKRSKLKYFYADRLNFVPLCTNCHIKAEGTNKEQMELNCYRIMLKIKWMLMNHYRKLKLYEQSLDFKYK